MFSGNFQTIAITRESAFMPYASANKDEQLLRVTPEVQISSKRTKVYPASLYLITFSLRGRKESVWRSFLSDKERNLLCPSPFCANKRREGYPVLFVRILHMSSIWSNPRLSKPFLLAGTGRSKGFSMAINMGLYSGASTFARTFSCPSLYCLSKDPTRAV